MMLLPPEESKDVSYSNLEYVYYIPTFLPCSLYTIRIKRTKNNSNSIPVKDTLNSCNKIVDSQALSEFLLLVHKPILENNRKYDRFTPENKPSRSLLLIKIHVSILTDDKREGGNYRIQIGATLMVFIVCSVEKANLLRHPLHAEGVSHMEDGAIIPTQTYKPIK
jgi:hypothetical protein